MKFPQASYQLKIPREHHRFILGKQGKKLQELELNTATKITIPRTDENSDIVKITGTKEGIEKAKHEIEIISDEQVSLTIEITLIELSFFLRTTYIMCNVTELRAIVATNLTFLV